MRKATIAMLPGDKSRAVLTPEALNIIAALGHETASGARVAHVVVDRAGAYTIASCTDWQLSAVLAMEAAA